MISIAWATGVITVPQSFLTLISGTSYSMDVDVFRLALKSLEDDEEGMAWPRTHNHNTEIVLAGITFARSVEIIYPYTVEFEDGVYGVTLTGANNNIPDVLVRNSVSVNSANSAGLIVAGGGLSDAQATMLEELWLLRGLDPTKPLVTTNTTRKIPSDGSDIDQTVTESPPGTITVQRV